MNSQVERSPCGKKGKKSLQEKWDSVEWRTGTVSNSGKVREKGGSWRRIMAENQTAKEHVIRTSEQSKSCGHNFQVKLPIDDHRHKILDHVRKHRITFIQGDPGCGKSTAVPQFILDDFPTAISLAQRVARLRNQNVGGEVGYCVGHDHKTSGEKTRLFYMTSGYLLDWLGFQWDKDKPLRECMTHLILDEVHERTREHDLLLLMIKKLLQKDEASGNPSQGFPKIIIMSATLQAKPFRDYFADISQTSRKRNGYSISLSDEATGTSEDILSVGVHRFPVDIVFLEDIVEAIPSLDNSAKGILQRLLKFPAMGTFFPGFAFPLVVHLVKNTAKVGDVVLVFVPGLMDITQMQEAFKMQPGGKVPIETFLLHSILDKDEQAEVFQLPPPGVSKVVIATSIAESSITIPGVRFVIDLGMTKTMDYDNQLGIERLQCGWCTKASATQRAGRVGRLYPGTVFRLFTKPTYDRFQEYVSSSSRQQDVEFQVLKLKSVFTVFGSTHQLLREVLEPPAPKLVDAAIRALTSMGALVYSRNGPLEEIQVTPLGRLAMRIGSDIKVAKLVMLGLVMKCSPDCVVMGAALQNEKDDLFNANQMYTNQRDLLKSQMQLLECFKARRKYDDGHYSELVMYRQLYLEGQQFRFNRKWMEQNCISYHRFHLFMLKIRKYATATVEFLLEHKLSDAMHIEGGKLEVLAKHGRGAEGRPGAIFRTDLTMVKLAITAAFAGQVIIGSNPDTKHALCEVQELERAGLPPASSFKLKGVDSTPLDLEKLRRALEVIDPSMKVLPSSMDGSAALIRCLKPGLSSRYTEPVIRDLPESGLSLFHLPRVISAKGTTIVQIPEPDGCREVHIGRPSKSRQISWSTTMNGQKQKVKFDKISVLDPAFDTRTREEVSFHIGVAHHFLGTKVTSSVTAHFVTILPPQNLFSILAMLLCWSPGKDHLELRMDTSGSRIYWIRIGTKLSLHLAPRYLVLRQLDLIENARIKIRRFMAGEILQDGNLEKDIMQILTPDGQSQYQPVLAPELGPWLVYPSMQLSHLSHTMRNVKVPNGRRDQGAGRTQQIQKVRAEQKTVPSAGLGSEATTNANFAQKNRQKHVFRKVATTDLQDLTGNKVTVCENIDDTGPGTVSPHLERGLKIPGIREGQVPTPSQRRSIEGWVEEVSAGTCLSNTEATRHGSEPLLIFSRGDIIIGDDAKSAHHPCSEELDRKTSSTCSEEYESKNVSSVKQEGEFMASQSSDIQILHYTFQQVCPNINLHTVQDWLSGQRVHNQMFFSLLEELNHLSISTKDKKLHHNIQEALEIVHKGRLELVNKKQQKRVEAIYHSICNPDKPEGIQLSNWATSPGQAVQVGRHSLQYIHNQPLVTTISRSLSLPGHARSLLTQKMKYLPIPRVSIAIPPLASKSNLVIVSGPPMEVQQALQWIESAVLNQSPGKWGSDKTYIDSEDMSTKIRFIGAQQCHDREREKTRTNNWSECVLQLNEVVQSPNLKTPSIHLTDQIFKDFESALEKVSSSMKVEMQGRLGRVVLSHRSSERWSMPYESSQPLRNLICDLTNKKVNKQRFDDSMDSREFSYLRAALGICRPKKIWRQNVIILVVSSLPNCLTHVPKNKKFTIIESNSQPSSFILRFVQNRTRLATADIVRLHAGAIKTDVRISMMTTEQKEISEQDTAFVKGINRKGAVISFPSEYYSVHTQRLKEAEVFLFDGLKVTLTEVTQARGYGNSRIKYEVEFEVVDPGEEGSRTCFMSPQLLAQRVTLLLKEIQYICTHLCLSLSNTPAKNLAQKLLLHWKMHNENISGLQEMLEAAIYTDHPCNSDSEINTRLTNSMLIAELVEHFHYFDDCLTARGNDASNDLLLAVLKTLHKMNIVLAGDSEQRAEVLIISGQLHPKAALRYSCLVPTLFQAKAHLNETLISYVCQMRLEQQNEEADDLVKSLGLRDEPKESSSGHLVHMISRIGSHDLLCCLRRLIYSNNASQFMVLLPHALQQETPEATAALQEKLKTILCHHAARAGEFVLQCSNWYLQTSEVRQSTAGIATNTKSTISWLIQMIELLNIPITEECRLLAMSQLVQLAPVREGAQDIEEKVFETYTVDEALFRNEHYQRILRCLVLNQSHTEELLRRGLTESQCRVFKTLSHGHRVKSSCLIPGLNGNGDRLIGSPGIIIPARDPTGQITGAQIKVDNPSSGKYKWWSSKNQGGKGPRVGYDFPLFCCVPQGQESSVVGLCEGGLKAHVAAALTGLPMIGAAGAAFPQSKSLLETYLAMMNPTHILFFPDAGSTSNDQVTDWYFQTFRLLRAWNYKVLVAWWGQVNKEEHHDIDDLLCSNDSMHDIPLLSVRQFWQVLHPDIRNSLSEAFLEFSKPREVKAEPKEHDMEEEFCDSDGIQILQTASQRFMVSIPKSIMTKMPAPPNGLVTTPSVKTFSIEACMVWVNNVQETDQLVDWLMQDEKPDKGIIGLDCEHGLDGSLNLIQLSVHCRCLLICIPSHISDHVIPVSVRLALLLASRTHIKTGAEVHKDALAIYHGLGILVNGCKNVSHVYRINNQTSSMLTIFRTLYGWEWQKLKSISCSDWGSMNKSLEQIKYAVLDAWSSRMIALEGRACEEGAIPVVSLEDHPRKVLDLFGRAISHSDVLKKEETVIEGAGNITAICPGTLRLQQTRFRSRVLAPKSRVELRFKDGQETQQCIATARAGKSVTLQCMSTSTKSSESGKVLDLESISSIFIDNRMHANTQKRKLEEALYKILCKQAECPLHILHALKCIDIHPKELGMREGYSSKLIAVEHICNNLNKSQRNAWAEILTSPLAATIGPPGTGKTRLIASVTQAWNALAKEGDILLCTAFQNVATRHIAETLVRHQVPGVMLLISQDYYLEWHEELYHELRENLIVLRPGHCDLLSELSLWEAKQKRRAPRVVICTLTLVGCQAFRSSLMKGKVTMMLVDECSQAVEGSILSPLLCLPDLLQVGVLGDPNQLPPYGRHDTSTKSVYDLMSMGCNPVLLEEQYRMPPPICEFISGEFYNKKLKTAPTRQAQTDYRNPMLWIHIPGSTSVLPGKTSLSNQAEAEAIKTFCLDYAATMTGLSCRDEGKGAGDTLQAHHAALHTSLVVLTLYEEQRQLISRLLKQSGLEFQVHNVDSFQGQEAETVLISLVVADRFSSFAADPNRACVVLSRAKGLLCIFGNLHSVVKNPRAEVWGRLASHCQKHQWVVEQSDIKAAMEGNGNGSSTTKTLSCSVM